MSELVRPRRHHRTARPSGFLAWLRTRRSELEYQAWVEEFLLQLRGVFREACQFTGLCHYISAAAGPTVRTPRIGNVVLGPPISLTVELMPGQEPEDFRAPGQRVAHTLGGHGLRIERLSARWLRLVLVDADPLGDPFPLPDVVVASGRESLLLGRG